MADLDTEASQDSPPLTRAEQKAKLRPGRRSPICLNCGELTPSNFCAGCGQANSTYRVSTRQIVGDFINDYFTVDLKFPKSVLPLLFKPGFLTSEYIAGRRARYIAPLRMYLFVSVAYFFILSLDANNLKFSDQPPKPPVAAKAAKAGAPPAKGPPDKGVLVFPQSKEQQRSAKAEVDTLDFESGNPTFDAFMKNRVRDKVSSYTVPNGGQRLVQDALDNVPIAMFVLLPVFALLLKLLYWRGHHFYAEHLIFSLHYHSFVFTLLLLVAFVHNSLVSLLNEAVLWSVVPLAILVYLVWAMKTVYRQGLGKTLVKFVLLLSGYSTAIVFSIVLVALLLFLR
ncbi:DUF3667 domain-containing protein [Gloeobacter kilaueensis]|uniref:DUF3667 domain-containing protein n=1 Tax=Gloeobacter kilaueensis (strain ATCC BAA-2537 / CCAP 1431/1 / ULC 316 / JS1) TaxID=1183438 RepID=U5QFT6_GLOK1|nr:DUF3667 domain-containing protein [Gloeobacter kilaueensis]AGY57748.1 hypothetical protein GKIL_1502 [Gloeobacter kilaueensis JS1]